MARERPARMSLEHTAGPGQGRSVEPPSQGLQRGTEQSSGGPRTAPTSLPQAQASTCVTCYELGLSLGQGEHDWAPLSLMRAPGLRGPQPDVARCSGPASARRRNGAQLGPPRLGHPRAAMLCLSSAVGTGAGPWGHMSPSCAHPQQCQARECTHAHTHTRTVVHKHQVTPTSTLTPGLYGKTSTPRPQPPPAVKFFTPRARPEDTPSSRAPPSPKPLSLPPCPVLAFTPPSCGALLSRSTQGVAPSTWGRRGALKSTPLPPPILPWDLSTQDPGASRPPVGPSSRSLKARGGLGRI